MKVQVFETFEFKIHQIPCVSFEMTSQFLFSVITYNYSVAHVVCSSFIFYFEQKDPIKLVLTFSSILMKIC